MGVAVIPARLCAVNPDHGAATTSTTIDGRRFPVCAGCVVGDVEVRGKPRRRGVMGRPKSPLRGLVVVALGTSPGADLATLARFCDAPLGGSKYETMRRLICDMVAAGDIERTGNHHGPRFYLRGERPS